MIIISLKWIIDIRMGDLENSMLYHIGFEI